MALDIAPQKMLMLCTNNMATLISSARGLSLSLRRSPCLVTLLLLVLMFIHVFPAVLAISRTTVTHLPGFQGPLPFHLETGYVTVGEPEEDAEIFYYFMKSWRNPKEDALILWLVGGPGCSALSTLFFEIGPLLVKRELYNGTLPTIFSNPYTWIQAANLLVVDLPVNTGFSYAKSKLKSERSDYQQIVHGIQFLRNWLNDRPEYLSNPLYLGGTSYSAVIVAAMALQMDHENEKDIEPLLNLKGYILGNPRVNHTKELNTRIEYAFRLGLISEELYESLKRNCKGAYQPFQIDPSNTLCLRDVQGFETCTSKLNGASILEYECGLEAGQQPTIALSHRSLGEFSDHLLQYNKSDYANCPDYAYVLGEYWGNDKDVQRSLGVRPGAVNEFIRCKRDPYVFQIFDSLETHAKLSAKGYRSLIFSGDHDLWISHISTQAWIKSLNYSIVDDWRPWFAVDQVGGYTRSYSNQMTFATVKGGKHVAPMNRPKESWFMFEKWISGLPL